MPPSDVEPLLPSSQRASISPSRDRRPIKDVKEGNASMMSGIANLSNTILGTGMLAMPRAFASGGLIPGIFTVIWSAATSALGLYFLSRAARKAPHRKASFAELSKLSFPRIGKLFDLAIFLKCYGVSISYLIIIGGLMPRVVLAFDTHPDPHLLDRRFWILVAITLLCPLAFLRKLDNLKFTSYIALVAVVNLVFVVIYKYFVPEGLSLPDLDEIPLWDVDTKFLATLPVQVFAFTCAQNLFAIHNELISNTQARMDAVIGTSIGSAATLYIVLGTLGLLTFGVNVGPNIIEMYPHAWYVSLCQLGITIMVLFSYPLQLHPARASLDKVFFNHKHEETGVTGPHDDDEDENNTTSADIPLHWFTAETCFILLTTFIVSILVDDLTVVLGFVGSTGSVTISFILPAVYFWKLFQNSDSSRDQKLRVAAVLLLCWGFFVMIVSLSLQIYQLLSLGVKVLKTTTSS